MTIKSLLVKNVLQTYDRQIDSARRLVRLRQSLAKSEALDSVSISREAKRRQLVERVAREIVDSLLVSNNPNAVVEDIKRELEAEIGQELLFSFPPTEGQLKILKQTANGTVQISAKERERILAKLWVIALKKVDETML